MKTGKPHNGHSPHLLTSVDGREQFAGLYRKFGSSIMGMATRAARNDPRTAEDILHKVMLQLFYMPAAVNEANDSAMFRHIATLTRAVIREAIPPALAKPFDGNGAHFTASPESVLELAHDRGYTLTDTAELLNISLEQTKTLLKTAMNNLKMSQHG